MDNCTDVSHGTCIAPNTCLCEAQYDGDSCNETAESNANPPVFPTVKVSLTAATNSRVGSTILTLSATDGDRGKNGRLSYSITSTNNNHTHFRLNGSSADIILSKSLKYLSGSLLMFELFAIDGGEPSLTGSVDIEVSVVKPNQHCPVFKNFPKVVNVPESAGTGYVIAHVTATDDDGSDSVNGVVSYSLETTNTGKSSTGNTTQNQLPTDADSFSINTNSGKITSRRPLSDDTYSVIAVASDQASPPCSSTATLQVNVLSSNTPPVCEPSNVATSLPYTTAVGSHVLRLDAVDNDNGTDGDLTFSYSNFQSLFLHNVSPLTLLQRNKTAYLLLSSPLRSPVNSNSTFYDLSLLVSVTDAARRPRSCSFAVTVIVTHPFQFRHTTLSSSINENADKGVRLILTPSLKLLTNLTKITYSLRNADQLPFTVNPNTGILTVSGSVDYEATSHYNVAVVARTSVDPQVFSVAHVDITVIDENDNPPRFPFSHYNVYVKEDVERSVILLSLSASDVDSIGGPIVYSLTSQTSVDKNYPFAVSSFAHGLMIYVTDKAELDYKITNRYELVIKTWDHANSSLFSFAHVTIHVEEGKFPRPAFQRRSYDGWVQENTDNGEIVLTIPALAYGKLSNPVTYSITNQMSDALPISAFNVSSNGSIVVSNSSLLDYEILHHISFTLVATVTRPRLRTAQTTVTVRIEDVNDNRPQFDKNKYETEVAVNAAIGFTIVDATAQDADSGNVFVTYVRYLMN